MVGRSGHYFFFYIFFFFLVAKMTPLKNNKSLMFFEEKFWKKIFSYFQKFLSKFSLTLTKNDWVYIVLANYKKKSTKMENLGQLRPVKQGLTDEF